MVPDQPAEITVTEDELAVLDGVLDRLLAKAVHEGIALVDSTGFRLVLQNTDSGWRFFGGMKLSKDRKACKKHYRCHLKNGH